MTNYDTETGEQTRIYVEEYELDDNGFATDIKTTLNGAGQGTTHVEAEYDKNGLTLAETEDYTSKKYEYFPSGRVKSRTFDNGNYQEVQKYDESGLRLRTLHEEDGKTTDSTYVWEKDAEGNPVSCVMSGALSANGAKEPYRRSYTVKTNEYGGIDEICDAETGIVRVKVQDYATMASGNVSLYGKQRFTAPIPDEGLGLA